MCPPQFGARGIIDTNLRAERPTPGGAPTFPVFFIQRKPMAATRSLQPLQCLPDLAPTPWARLPDTGLRCGATAAH